MAKVMIVVDVDSELDGLLVDGGGDGVDVVDSE